MPQDGNINTQPEMMEAGRSTDFLAETARFTGDLLTDTRAKIGTILGAFILLNEDYQSKVLSGITTATGAGDGFDGVFKRFWAKRTGVELTPEDARKDESVDKDWAHLLMGAMTIRAFLNKDYALASFLLANQAVIMGRDALVTQARNDGQARGADVSAQMLGKVKTGLQNAAFSHQTSPNAKTRTGRKIFYGMQATSTGLSVISGISKIRSIRKQRSNPA